MACLVARTGRQLQRYDNMGRRQVVGCIPYRYKICSDGSVSDELEVLVITSQKGSGGMMFPKGGWELDESVEQAAARESLEEAGVLGKVEDRYIYEGYMFPLLVTEQLDIWPEKNMRQRIWMTVEEAQEVCRHLWMKEALDRFVERLTALQLQQEDNVL
ncbi:hypothetical protein K2173_012668 [Erythroxylum novogranatense]|uniref:Nudix hydrolase domain-containing protein n=1 Tax=Erythroxylum novogranatense TaxID=1862640 RepID=A0AAV8S6D3_9ROSI|nr:hypothetical protein K2173_012668 [Erythroxylum novogranatense]